MAKEQTAIQYCEEKFPQTTTEFKEILDEILMDSLKKSLRNCVQIDFGCPRPKSLPR